MNGVTTDLLPTEVLRSAVLGLIQGLTEFLPISSSAHLILLPKLLEWPDQGLAFDIAANTGTLVALLLYFRTDISGVLLRRSSNGEPGVPLLRWLMLATVPVGVVGLLTADWIGGEARNPRLIAATSIGFGVLLWLADGLVRRSRSQVAGGKWERFGQRSVDSPLGLRDAIVLGLAQAIALVPGTSRSGAVLTAGLVSGFDREAAARLAFLMAIPVGFLVAAKDIVTFTSSAEPVAWTPLFVGFACAAISGYVVISLLLEWLKVRGLMPFVVYRIALGIGILVLFR